MTSAADILFARGLAMPNEQWKPLNAPLQNGASQRSADALRAVAAQFNVETANRYRPRDGLTFCNIYVWDVTRALRCEIPHWVDDTGKACEPLAGIELNCNATVQWLEHYGKDSGWHETTELSATIHASGGGPAIAIWRNPAKRPGHVAVLLPGPDNEPRIAQAGADNLFDHPLTEGFGRVHGVRYFRHA